jgi:hypothetical protein
VFGLLSAQLVLTAVVAAPIVMHSGVKSFVMTSPWVTMLVRYASSVIDYNNSWQWRQGDMSCGRPTS